MKQREIKFRVWTGAQMEYKVIAGELGSFYAQGLDPNDAACISPMNTKYPNETPIMQFTGIKDKNGKEIYEGDVIDCYWLAELGITEIDCSAKGQVLYQPAIAAYIVEFDKPFRTGVMPDGFYEEEQLQLREYNEDESISFEIIGNIYENANLLT